MFKTSNGRPAPIMGGLPFVGSDTPDSGTVRACYASSIRDKLGFTLATTVAEKSRGFDPCFLSTPMDVPGMSQELDGGHMKKLSHKGINFRYDDRFDHALQAGNGLYKDNDLDRGYLHQHCTRR
ncbi:hypothetical protein [Corynebacterium cystitidis]|uniref:hypothetical protein n=1 Tax=Corynebacterium cystitidis TaxID=35757 RepID=UPI00211F2F6F|nr:hypothetical protein [Corynebacterium cystitidis]